MISWSFLKCVNIGVAMWQWGSMSGLLLLTALVATGEVSVGLRSSAAAISTAERLTLTLSVDAPFGHRVTVPDKARDFGAFTLISASPPQRQRFGSGLRHTRSFVLEPFLAGDYEIPALTVWTTDAFGQQTRHETTPMNIPVRSVIQGAPSEAEMMPLAEDLPPAQTSNLHRVLAALLAGIAVWIFARRRKAAPTEARDPRQALIDELAAMPRGFTPAMLAGCMKSTWRDPHYRPEWQRLEVTLFGRGEADAAELDGLVEAFRTRLGGAA